MTLDQLEILEAVVSTGSFRAAADQLGRTQPAISIAVKKLEDELKLQIFVRSHRHTQLTPAGERIFEEARYILKGSQRLKDLSRYLNSENEPVLRLAVDVVSPLNQLLPSLRSFFSMHKQTQLDLSFEVLGGVIEKLEQEKADLVISNLSSTQTKVESLPIWEVEMIPVCAPAYMDLQGNGFIEEVKLRDYTQIVISETSEARSSRQSILDGAHQWYVSSLEIKYELILAGMGWGSMPRDKVADDLAKGKLLSLHSENLNSQNIPFYMFRRQDKLHGPVATALWSHFLDQVELRPETT
ncbi:LysR family transcriptional regulator [Lentisphaera profundi]|uniref:LysR family transcriptional regulator n=1 Tax=Lentisphaera profundi TaxID=1658616 RepID=A0ABY7VYL1_9BACT|nr:LysR family transcriptional regulator [Lentisphaera profundi]WDE98986.1 LysR family transcriptional regulator [Lentisphaera profundi]